MDFRRRWQALHNLNPLWVLSVGAVILAIAAGALVQRHLADSVRLEDRLSGGALVDALRLYAQAAAPGQPTRPQGLGDLVDDTRGGQHRSWLDTVSAAALGDPLRWTPVRDAEGRLMGMQQRGGAATSATPSSAADDGGGPATASYVLQVAPAPDTAGFDQSAPEVVLPQPVMPEGGLPSLKLAGSPPAVALAGAAATARAVVRSGADRQAAAGTVPPVSTAPLASPAAPGLKPSRIIAGLEARQVLRLSGGNDEAPLLVPRHTVPAGKPAPAARSASATPLHPIINTRAQGRAVTPATVSSVGGPGDPGASPSASHAAAKPVRAPVAAEPASPDVPEPLPPGVPLNVPMSPPTASGARVDTVIYEEGPALPAEAPVLPADALTPTVPAGAAATASCRALTGDSAQCEALADSAPPLYLRCYQSLTERINACLAGEPVPPLITR